MTDHMTAEQLRAELDSLAFFAENGNKSQAWVTIGRNLRRLSASISGVAVAPTWQPIETAPRNGTDVLIAYKNVCSEWRVLHAHWITPWEGAPMERCNWRSGDGRMVLDMSVHKTGATNWMPMPGAPEPPHD